MVQGTPLPFWCFSTICTIFHHSPTLTPWTITQIVSFSPSGRQFDTFRRLFPFHSQFVSIWHAVRWCVRMLPFYHRTSSRWICREDCFVAEIIIIHYYYNQTSSRWICREDCFVAEIVEFLKSGRLLCGWNSGMERLLNPIRDGHFFYLE